MGTGTRGMERRTGDGGRGAGERRIGGRHPHFFDLLVASPVRGLTTSRHQGALVLKAHLDAPTSRDAQYLESQASAPTFGAKQDGSAGVIRRASTTTCVRIDDADTGGKESMHARTHGCARGHAHEDTQGHTNTTHPTTKTTQHDATHTDTTEYDKRPNET